MAKSARTKEEQRRYNMSRIRSTETKIEANFRKALWHEGIRYRKNYRLLPGAPDIVITKYKIAIFCDGEFWHGKNWDIKKAKIQVNRDYWITKIEKTINHDKKINQLLQASGWTVLRFWGNEIKKDLNSCVDEVIAAVVQAKADSIESVLVEADY